MEEIQREELYRGGLNHGIIKKNSKSHKEATTLLQGQSAKNAQNRPAEEGDSLMFGILCLLFAIFCDFKDMYIGKGMPSQEEYYGKFVADNNKVWYDHLRNCQAGKESWTSWDDPRIKWEDKLKK